MLNDILPDFQRHLVDRKLVSSDKIPFHALWVSKFLAFSNKRLEKNLNLRISLFLDTPSRFRKPISPTSGKFMSKAPESSLDNFLQSIDSFRSRVYQRA